MALSNVDLWNGIRAAYPNFRNHTSEATRADFTESGFEKLANYSIKTLNEFWELSIRVFLQTINISDARDNLELQGFGEVYEQARGGYIQRLAIMPMKPISPKYKTLENGKSVDPFTVRKPKVEERFFKQNFNYQHLLTLPDEYQYKQIFISEYGMSEFIAGLMKQMENAYIEQKYVNKLEAISAGINSKTNPLQKSQKVTVSLSENPTSDELVNFILTIKNVISAMSVGASSSAFNAMHFQTAQQKDRLKLLIRPQFRNMIDVLVARLSYNADTLNIPIDIVEVENFGGLQPYLNANFSTPLHEVYDAFGSVIGYNTDEGSDIVTVKEHDVFWKDPNEKIHAIIADKGWLFESIQNPYRVEPIRNPAGLYTNYWASAPNNAVLVDALYNVVIIQNA